jgi:hypothetical protein
MCLYLEHGLKDKFHVNIFLSILCQKFKFSYFFVIGGYEYTFGTSTSGVFVEQEVKKKYF